MDDVSNITLNVNWLTAVLSVLSITAMVIGAMKVLIKTEISDLKEKIGSMEKEQKRLDEQQEKQEAQHKADLQEIMELLKQLGKSINDLSLAHAKIESKIDSIKIELSSSIANSKSEILRDTDGKNSDTKETLRKEFYGEIAKVKSEIMSDIASFKRDSRKSG